VSEQLALLLTPPPALDGWKAMLRIHGADIPGLFAEVTFVPDARVKRLIQEHCLAHKALAFIDEDPKHGLVWHTADIRKRVHRKPIAAQFG
jgi:hypothetical protein